MTSSIVGIIWTVLSVIVTGCCCFSMIQPVWLVNPDTLNSLGMLSFCFRDTSFRGQWCGIYGGHFDLSNLPANAWQAASVLYGTGCVLLLLGSILSLSTLCINAPNNRRLSMVTGYIQVMAVILLASGLLVFPVGLDSAFVQQYCPGAFRYMAGSCHVGWSYMLAIVGTAVGVFCPFLSHYTDVKVRERSLLL